MAASTFLLFLLLASFTSQSALSATPPPDSSPSPSPDLDADLLPSTASSPSPSPASPPSDSPISSPPAPPPSDLVSPPPASPSPANPDVPSPLPVPVPAPSDLLSDISHSNNVEAGAAVDEDSGSSGMDGGKKAGIAVGVIAAAAVVGVGAMVYKKRQDNIRRSQYGQEGIALNRF